MMPVRVFLSLLMLVTFVHTVDRCNNRRLDGCSTPNGTPFKRKFTPSCYKHDVCYRCGSKFGKLRGWCDGEFNINMRRSCNGNLMCQHWANTYYSGVKLLGKRFYQPQPKSWCDEDWVEGCL